MTPQRHPATTDAWEWLEKGEGRERTHGQQERIRSLLERMDRELHEADTGETGPLPDDYWETAE